MKKKRYIYGITNQLAYQIDHYVHMLTLCIDNDEEEKIKYSKLLSDLLTTKNTLLWEIDKDTEEED